MWRDSRAAGLEAELQPSERVLWIGRPKHGLLAHNRDLAFVLRGLLWVFLLLLVAQDVMFGPKPFVLSGRMIGEILLSAHLFVAFFVVFPLQRSHTYYALTDQRVIAVSGVLRRRVQSIYLPSRPSLRLTEESEADDRGDILITPEVFLAGWQPTPNQAPSLSHAAPLYLETVPHVHELYQDIERLERHRPEDTTAEDIETEAPVSPPDPSGGDGEPDNVLGDSPVIGGERQVEAARLSEPAQRRGRAPRRIARAARPRFSLACIKRSSLRTRG